MLRFFKRNRQQDLEHTQDAVKPSRERWFGRILNVLRSSKLDDALWEELEEILISSDVGVDTSLRTIEELKVTVREKHLESGEQVFESLKEPLVAGMDPENPESVYSDETEVSGPYVILMVGVNGVGKTTSIAKLAHILQQAGSTCILAAADTFRAGAIEQLKIWGDRLGQRVVGALIGLVVVRQKAGAERALKRRKFARVGGDLLHGLGKAQVVFGANQARPLVDYDAGVVRAPEATGSQPILHHR